MPDYRVILTEDEKNYMERFVKKGGEEYTERFEWHYPPKCGSCLDMAEIEIRVLSWQALSMPLPDFDSFRRHVPSWTAKRNAEAVI